MSNLKERLKIKLQEKGMSVQALATQAGIPPSSLKNIMQGKVTDPRTSTIAALATYLDCPLHELIPSYKPVRRNNAKEASIDTTALLYAATSLGLAIKKHNIKIPKSRLSSLLDEIYTHTEHAFQKNEPVETISNFIDWFLEREGLI